MRVRQQRWSLILLVGVIGCQVQSATQQTLATDSAAIEKAVQAMTEASGRGDWESWASWFTDDAIVMVPNRPAIAGRSNIRAFVQDWPPIKGSGVELLELEIRADLAYVRGRYRMRMAMPDGRMVDDSGKTVEIWRKQGDGRWLVARDISSSDVAR
ncbi:MAG: YybH family protein [Longimicrobiales bacterium]